MLQKASPRRALAPLPVNTMTSNISSSNDGIATRKRGIDEVEDSELPSRAIRMRTVPQQPLGNQESQPPMQNGVNLTPHSNFNTVQSAHPLKEESDVETVASSNGSLSTIRHRSVNSEPVSSQETTATETTPPRRSIVELAQTLRLRLQLAMFKVRTGQEDVPFDLLQMPEHVPKAPTSSRLEENPKAPAPKLLPAPDLRPAAYTSGLVFHRRVASSPSIFNQKSPRTDMVLSNKLVPSTPKSKGRNDSWAMSASPNRYKAQSITTKERSSRHCSVSGEAASCLLDFKHQSN